MTPAIAGIRLNVRGLLTGDHAPGDAPKRSHAKPGAVRAPTATRDEREERLRAAGWRLGPRGWWHEAVGVGGGVMGGETQAWATMTSGGGRWERMLDEANET